MKKRKNLIVYLKKMGNFDRHINSSEKEKKWRILGTFLDKEKYEGFYLDFELEKIDDMKNTIALIKEEVENHFYNELPIDVTVKFMTNFIGVSEHFEVKELGEVAQFGRAQG